jgi:sec-independent protein translocase protein TatB
MFDIGSSELLLIIVVAIVVIGPKDLPRALYKLGQVIGKAKGMARHFRTGVDAMIREAELEELQKQWAKENERIMASTRIPEFDAAAEPVVDETAPQLPAPETAESADAVAPDVPPYQTDPGPQSDPDQPGLPLETPKGTSAA